MKEKSGSVSWSSTASGWLKRVTLATKMSRTSLLTGRIASFRSSGK